MATATYTPIATQTLGSAAASITFNSIPNSYTDLRLVLIGYGTVSGGVPRMVLNSDSGSNYSLAEIGNGSSTIASLNATSQTFVYVGTNGEISNGTTTPTLTTVDFFSYAGSTNKMFLYSGADDFNGTGYAQLGIGLWRSTSAITSIGLTLNSGNYATGFTATLWGI